MTRSGTQFHSENTERQIAEEYLAGENIKALMARYGYKTRKSVTDKVKKHIDPDFDFVAFNKQKRQEGKKYKLDFSKINSPFNAYFIGLMLTDGYVADERAFGIDLTDEDAIFFIFQSTGQKYNTYQGTIKDKHRIVFSEKDNVEQLARYGILQRKSYILKGFDLLPEEYPYIPYLIRGIIDGDGYIGYTSYGKLHFSIASVSQPFLEWIVTLLKNHLYMYQLENIYYYPETGVCSISTALRRNIQILKTIVYDQPYGMARKYNILHGEGSETIIETSQRDDGIVQPATTL